MNSNSMKMHFVNLYEKNSKFSIMFGYNARSLCLKESSLSEYKTKS